MALPYLVVGETQSHSVAAPASSLEADLAMLHAQVDGEAYKGGVLHDELLDKGKPRRSQSFGHAETCVFLILMH